MRAREVVDVRERPAQHHFAIGLDQDHIDRRAGAGEVSQKRVVQAGIRVDSGDIVAGIAADRGKIAAGHNLAVGLHPQAQHIRVKAGAQRHKSRIHRAGRLVIEIRVQNGDRGHRRRTKRDPRRAEVGQLHVEEELAVGRILDVIVEHRHREAGGHLIGLEYERAGGLHIVGSDTLAGVVSIARIIGGGVIHGQGLGRAAGTDHGDGGITAILTDGVIAGTELQRTEFIVVVDANVGHGIAVVQHGRSIGRVAHRV